MPKSRNKKSHKTRLANYKTNKKKEQDSFKKKMIEQYMKMQQQAVADKESHSSTEEVSGLDIDVDSLNESSEIQHEMPTIIDAGNIIGNMETDTESRIEIESLDVNPVIEIENTNIDDNNNK